MGVTPDVSVVIPTSGRWPFLETALRAIRMQEGVRAEAVVVVNGPRAGDWESVPFLRAPDVRVLASIGHGSQADARNRGLALARGRFVALLDDDDVWAPGKLAAQIRAIEAEQADFAYSSCVVVTPELAVRWVETAPPPGELPRRLLENTPIPACSSNLLIDAALAREVRFDREFDHVTDWDFAVRLIEVGKAASVPDVHVGYLWHPASLHTTRINGVDAEFEALQAKHLAHGRHLRVPSEARWNAAAHRESGRRVRAAAEYLRAGVRHRSPSDLARAGVVLLGERAMRAGSRRREDAGGGEPGWLGLYRDHR